MRTQLVLLICLGCQVSCFGGQVSDGVSGEYVEGALVKVKNCSTCQEYQDTTGPNGEWKFDSCNEPSDPLIMQEGVDAVRIQITKPGYAPATIYHQVIYDRQDQNGCHYDIRDAELFPSVVTDCGEFYSDDCDFDGLTNQQESKIGTHYRQPDTDCDGLNDGHEVNGHNWIDYSYLGADPTRKSCLFSSQSSGYPDSYHYKGNYPSDRDRSYFDNLQGVTHDDSYWYFTQSNGFGAQREAHLMKFSVYSSLGSANPVADVNLESMGLPDHPGDISLASHAGHDYLFIPIYWESGYDEMLMVVFRTDNLNQVWASHYIRSVKASWCAVLDDQKLYINDGTITPSNPIWVWNIEWSKLANGQDGFLRFSNFFQLYKEDGSPFGSRDLEWQQGADFSPDGKVFFMSHGGSGQSAYRGIKVFRVSDGRLINQSDMNDMPFKFEYHEGRFGDEPEGLTYWDLADKNIPNLTGQLHVVMIDNDAGNDDLYFKHYSLPCGQRCRLN